ncbi:MAG: ThuA domain-containing protein [Aquificae bacterium]|nr:ThuA domain-containing protein [Aquificota bacterium]
MSVKVGWDITHQEFTITDYYYFSILQREAQKAGIEIDEVDDWESLNKYDVIVLNYPEIPFTQEEVKDVQRWVQKDGKKVILAGYYKNEDKIADTCNTLARAFGMELNPDEVTDEVNNHKGDKYFVVTSKIRRYNKNEKNEVNVHKIMLACGASIKPIMPDIKVVARGEDTARSNMGNYPLLIAEQLHPQSGGYFCLAGTCVFWDNYSITLYDNLNFSLNLLKHRPPSKGTVLTIGP